MKPEQWTANESLHAQVNEPAIRDESENARMVQLGQRLAGSVRVRVMWGVYGPGTEQKPKKRYWWMLGENATIVCRDEKVYGWFREQLKAWLRDLDGVVLEEG